MISCLKISVAWKEMKKHCIWHACLFACFWLGGTQNISSNSASLRVCTQKINVFAILSMIYQTTLQIAASIIVAPKLSRNIEDTINVAPKTFKILQNAWESPFSAVCACNPALCCAWNARETSGETKMFKRVPQVWQQVPLIFANCLTLPRCHGRKLHNLCSHCPWPGFCEAEWQIWPKMTSADDRQKLNEVVVRQLERVEKRFAKAERDCKR